jgi:hypothetical protein
MRQHLPARLAALALGLSAFPLLFSACGDVAEPASSADVAGPQDDTTTPTDDVETPPEDTAGPTGAEGLQVLMDGAEYALAFGRSVAIDVLVPEGTVSLSISIVGSPGTYYVLDSWSDEFNNTLVTANWLAGQDAQGGLCTSCPNRINIADAAFASLAPNNPSVVLSPGLHTFTIAGFTPKPVVSQGSAVCGDNVCHFMDQFQCQADCGAIAAAGKVEVTVVAKTTTDGLLPEVGVLDLNLHFTGAQGLTAESAKTDATFQAALDRMRVIYSQVGISLGEITYRDIDASYAVIETFDGPESDLIQMFEESAGNPTGLNMFFVDELSAGQFGGFGMVLGIAGGIPGPPLLQGSPRSGVAVAVKPVEGAPASLETTMAHEAGHFLGLFHTSEQNFFGGPGIHDPLPDTPQNDEGYLMFNTGAGDVLSVQQGVVMRSNPFVRHPAN